MVGTGWLQRAEMSTSLPTLWSAWLGISRCATQCRSIRWNEVVHFLPKFARRACQRLRSLWSAYLDSPVLKLGIFAVIVLGSLSLLFVAHARPGYFNNQAYLAAFIFLQILVAAVWKFQQWFSVLLIL